MSLRAFRDSHVLLVRSYRSPPASKISKLFPKGEFCDFSIKFFCGVFFYEFPEARSSESQSYSRKVEFAGFRIKLFYGVFFCELLKAQKFGLLRPFPAWEDLYFSDKILLSV